MLIFRSASRRGVAACLSVVAPALVASACTAAGPGPERIGANASAVWSLGEEAYEDNADTDDLRQNIVVSLAKTVDGPSVCTGTLLTPRVVLTAASCKNDGKAGALPFVRVGGRVPFKQTARATSFLTANTPALEPSLSGKDVGVVFLDSPILETAQIHHPPFVAPPPTSIAPGGLETFPHVGMAGWSTLDPGGNPIPSPNARQAIVSDLFSMWRYWQISSAQEPLWVYSPFANGIPKSGLAAGDDGGPLFVLENGHRDIIGVASIIGMPLETGVRAQALPALQSPSQITQCDSIASGSVTSCTAWVDVTNVAVKSWITGAIADTTRGPRWLAMHPRTGGDQGTQLWIGDVDYTGPCTPGTDPDCDHTYTRNADNSLRDNCPDLANLDQVDSDDGSAGDACACPAGQIGVHEGDFSNHKQCVGIGVADVSSGNPLQSVSVPKDRDAIVCPQPGETGACVLRQADWLSTGALRTSGIRSAVVLDRNRTVPTPPPAFVQNDTTYADADYATIDMSAYSGDKLGACYERCNADARCSVLTLEGATCHLKATRTGFGASAAGSTSVKKVPVSIDDSGSHACALMVGGSVRCKGWNLYGQLGDGSTTDQTAGVPVTTLGGAARQVAAGSYHTCALMEDGSVKCWGYNANGELGDGTTTNHGLPAPVKGLSANITQIAAGFEYTCALAGDGTVQCWGYNPFGALGDNTTTSRTTPVTVSGLSGVRQIAAGVYHTCAVMNDSTVKCWGYNAYGELGDGSTNNRSVPGAVSGLTNVKQVTLGSAHTCALLNDGTIRCWGINGSHELGDGTTITRTSPVAVHLTATVTQLTHGWNHTCALTSTGAVRCWGSNETGELGDGTHLDRSYITIVGFNSSAIQVAGTCALMSARGVMCWGRESWDGYPDPIVF